MQQDEPEVEHESNQESSDIEMEDLNERTAPLMHNKTLLEEEEDDEEVQQPFTQVDFLRNRVDDEEEKSVRVVRSKRMLQESESSSYAEPNSGSGSSSGSSSSSPESEGYRPQRAAANRKNYREVQSSSSSSSSEHSNDELLENLAAKEIKLSPSKQEDEKLQFNQADNIEEESSPQNANAVLQLESEDEEMQDPYLA